MDKIGVVNFGSQYFQQIIQSLRGCGVLADGIDPDAPDEIFKNPEYKGFILSGGPKSVYASDAPPYNPLIFELGRPILGICYGHQLIAHHFGVGHYETVWPAKESAADEERRGEYGKATLKIICHDELFDGLAINEQIWVSHGDEVRALPPDFMLLASTDDCRISAMRHVSRLIFGIQFHPEVTHTLSGHKIFENFIKICGAAKEWTHEKMYENARRVLLQGVGEKYAVLLASGGNDSSVLAELAKQVLPHEKLFIIHIDTGLERESEPERVADFITGRFYLKTLLRGKVGLPPDVEDMMLERYRKTRFKNFILVRAEKEFMEALKEVYDPEEKRAKIAQAFAQVTRAEIVHLGLSHENCVILQGTIYPDTIESAGEKHADKIKSHHNILMAKDEALASFEVVEPLRLFFKDEVREFGASLGIEPELIFQEPFPGPGLAVRILCSAYPRYPHYVLNTETLKCERAMQALCRKSGFDGWIIPVKSVGVQGDERTYALCAAIVPYSQEFNFAQAISLAKELTNRFRKKINRVIMLIEPKDFQIPRAMLRKTDVNAKNLKLARKADKIVKDCLKMASWSGQVWQFPVPILPFGLGEEAYCVVLRPIDSVNAMTASVHTLPQPLLKQMAKTLLNLPDIEAVFYDLTSKPPGTIEWE